MGVAMNGKAIGFVALLVVVTAVILPAQGHASAHGSTAPESVSTTETPTATATATATGTGTSVANCGLIDGMVSYWKLDEPAGSALDSFGGNSLSANNAPGSTAG